MYSEEKGKRGWGRHWASAGFFGAGLTVTFVAVTLYLGAGGREVVREVVKKELSPGRKATIEMVRPEDARGVSPKFVRIPMGGDDVGVATEEEEFRVPGMGAGRPLHQVPAPSDEEAGPPVREGASKKRAEAVWPVPGFRRLPEDYYDDADQESEERLLAYLQTKVKDAVDLAAGARGEGWLEALQAFNASLNSRNVSSVVGRLRDLYSGDGGGGPLNNSLVSFGLLAVDLFLLHNVQQMAWENEPADDPDVLAMNALFLDPKRVRESLKGRALRPPEDKGVLQEISDFFDGALRAATNLGKAYMESAKTQKDSEPRSSPRPTPLDCLWTVYCRNLDKTARLGGPYGFLAKINSLGLRLMMKEFPIEKAMERFIMEVTTGWSPLDCQKLFPRCPAGEANEVVLKTALGENLVE